jgi:N-acetylmuramoyl-L-alanine amidase
MTIQEAPAHPANFSARPRGSQIEALVYHDTQGTVASALAWFRDPAAQVSAHYVVAKDGMVSRCVPEDMKAWHAGRSILFGRENVNDFSIGIELEDREDVGPYPEPQLAALVDLAANLAGRYRIPLNHIVGHEHICVPRGRKQDPGVDFDWYHHLVAVGGRLEG